MDSFEREHYIEYAEKWISGLDSEVGFWNNFLGVKGGKYKHEYSILTSNKVKFMYPSLLGDKKSVKVLDVGSAIISRVGNAYKDYKINLHSCDPLAPAYEMLLKRHKITPYIKTEFAFVERLNDRYESNYFDIVIMRNALDHSFYPYKGLLEMINVAKVNGTIYLEHYINEALCENYQGLHQWNINENNGELIFWRKEKIINISKELSEYVDIKCEIVTDSRTIGRMPEGKPIVIAKIYKKASIPYNEKTSLNVLDEFLIKNILINSSIYYKTMIKKQQPSLLFAKNKNVKLRIKNLIKIILVTLNIDIKVMPWLQAKLSRNN